MNHSAKFWDRVAARYAKRPIADDAAYQKKLRVTRDFLRPGMDVLELGCGTGSSAFLHAPRVKHILAIDISSNMIAIARGKADAKRIENVTFKCSAIEDLDVPDQSLDAVLAICVLHLLSDWQDAILRVHSMLKPGGVFVTSTACIGDSMKFFKVVAPVGEFLGLIPLVKVFTSTELEAGFCDAGFKIDYRWQPGKNKAVFMVASRALRPEFSGISRRVTLMALP